ncbi:hypothetical protein G3N57_03265 [Paraburkholderia sp. Se-20369]|nr:hypothetical protein [Paraburkholderia sp. Se-20369]
MDSHDVYERLAGPLAPAIRSCRSYSSAGDFVTSAAAAKTKPRVTDGIAYFKPRANITFNGNPVLAIYAYVHDVPYPRVVNAPGTDAYGYGVVMEGTAAFGEMQVKGRAAHATPSPVSMAGHECMEIGCND